MTTPLGQFRHVVQLVQPGPPVQTEGGGWTDAWIPLNPPVWHCAIQAASLRDLQRISGGTVSTTATHLVRGRYHAQLSAKVRMLFRDRSFDVQSVHDVDQRQVEVECICAETTTAATGPTVANVQSTQDRRWYARHTTT